MQRNHKANGLRHSETETWVIGKIILNVPAMIWRVFKWWKFTLSKMLHTNIKTQKAFPQNFNARVLTRLCLLQMTCQPLWQMCIHPSSPTFPLTWQTISSIYVHSKHALQPLSCPDPLILRAVVLTLETYGKCVFFTCMYCIWLKIYF